MPGAIVVFILVAWVLSCVKIIKEYERGVIFRLGRVQPQPKQPGLRLIFTPVDTLIKVSTQTQVSDVPPQDVITRDNVSLKVNAVVYYRVVDPIKAVVEVRDYMYATSQLAQTTLRSVVGEAELDELLAHREKINHQLQSILDSATDPWGIKVSNVEVKHVDLPQEMQRAMAKQAEAERERRAKVIGAQAEYEAATKLAEAAEIMSNRPITLQLRYLQTLADIATENNSTTIFPIPIDLFRAFIEKKSG
jgi:regulator of protease activity HflC (stomatin/prohibitin superfamily)